MPERNEAQETVIYEPDFGLKEKLGGVSLEQILTPKLIVEAEKVVASMEPELIAQIEEELHMLEAQVPKVKPGAKTGNALEEVVTAAFALKSKAGFCGYPLASALARSLYTFCELLDGNQPLTSKETEIVLCLIKALKAVIHMRVKGDGGETGKAIAAELQRLAGQFK